MIRNVLLTKMANEFRYWPVLHSAKEQLPNLPEPWRWEVVNVAKLGQQLIAREEDCLIGRVHWEKRRRELINEPDDKDAPEWAEWVFQRVSGDWLYTNKKPEFCESRELFGIPGWNFKVQMASRGKILAGHDWKKTLRRVKREEHSTKRTSADGVNTETVSPDGGVTSTMVHPRSVRGVSLLESIAENSAARAYITAFDDRMGPHGLPGNHQGHEQAPEHDPVNHPSHYMLFPGLESIDIIQRSLTPEQFAGFCMGNALKYRLRAGEKDDAVEDLGKANWYRDKLKEVSE